jgi:hypothetical protein
MGCTCHLGHPPCSYCVDYCYCDNCNEENHSDDIQDLDGLYLCTDCYELKEVTESKEYRYLYRTNNERLKNN